MSFLNFLRTAPVRVTMALLFVLLAAGDLRAQEDRVVAPEAAEPAAALPPLPPGTLPTVKRLIADIMRAESATNANELVLAYGQSVRDPQLARGALTLLLHDYYRLRAMATTAMQASQAVDETSLRFAIFQAAQSQVQVQQSLQTLEQNQRIIEQNDALIKQNETVIKQNERMISLLDKIARTR